MERIINTSIIDYLYLNKLVNAVQHGFLRKHSTCTNLLESVHDWSAALNDKHSVDVVYIDFQKLFDTVSHPKIAKSNVNMQLNSSVVFRKTSKGNIIQTGKKRLLSPEKSPHTQ
jgi:hypothetical protein